MQLIWNQEKDNLLKTKRSVSFEQVQEEIRNGCFIGPEQNPSHQNQLRIIVTLNDYPYVVPFVITKEGDWFLKTIYPSRKIKRRIENEQNTK